MKKVLLAGILSILFVGVSFAQVKFGVTAGLNVSKFANKDLNYDYKAGFQVGVVADCGITSNFSIIPELLFNQIGSKLKSDDRTDTFTLQYLQLPVNAAYKFDVAYNSKVLIFAGPYVGYGFSEQFKPLDFGMNAGIGYQFEKIFFKLQFNQGLSNFNSNHERGPSLKHQNIAVTAGYFF